MNKLNTLSEIKDLAQELRPLNLSNEELSQQLKGQTAVIAALVCWELENDELAKNFISMARDGEYYSVISQLLEPSNYRLLISKDVFDYFKLRTSKDENLIEIAKSYIAPSLSSLPVSDRVKIIKTLTNKDITATAKENIFKFDYPIHDSLLKELGIDKIEILESKLSTLMDYTNEEAPVYLLIKGDELFWAMKSQFVSSIEKTFNSIKYEMTSFLKNSFSSPKTRAVIYASLAIGVAIGLTDDAQAGTHTEQRIDMLVDYLDHIDGVLQNQVCGNMEQSVCQVKSTVISKTSTTLHAQINLGEYIIDIAPNPDPNKQHIIVSSAHKYYSPSISIVKSGARIPGYSITPEDVSAWTKLIQKHLTNIVYNGSPK
jgi:hypothetical protein